jgi:pimeloyl-ACP methyl ester carboxylesterase
MEITTFDRDLTESGCDANGNFAVVVHGWKESISTPWVMDTINNLRFYRGGCVIFMDYSNFSIVGDYFNLTPHFDDIAAVLLRKIKQIRNYDRLFLYGFSYGSRLCFEAGAQLGHQLIDRIDACDPAGPGFDMYKRTVDPKLAAKNVVCINTSVDKGTNKYNCHQNFRMGNCGKSQPAATRRPFGDHGLCPYFYNSAFKHNFTATKLHNCKSKRPLSDIPKGFTMGYSRQR